MRSIRASRTSHTPDSTLPLINIVLLLVLAFMIAGVVEAPLPEGFTPLQSTSESAVDQSTSALSIVVTQSGEALLEGEVVAHETLTALLTAAAGDERKLTIKADSRAPATLVIDLLARAEDAGIKNAVVMTIENDK
ncbi:MAG: ExbD/TolR family protein [Candidatus Phaeomarinobacter sp.]